MKRALVLSGGGSKGAYQVGALQHLILRQKRKYDAICGVSVGALNGSFLAQHNKSELEKGIHALSHMWHNIETKDIYKKWFLWPLSTLWKKSVYNSKPLSRLIDQKIDRNLLRNSDIGLYVGAVSLNNGYITYKTDRNKEIKKFIEASSAFPLMLTPVKTKYGWWADGGIRDVTPLKVAIETVEADEIDVILAQDKFVLNDIKKPSVIQDAPRILSIMMNEVIENDIKMAKIYNEAIPSPNSFFRDKRYIKINLIRPNGELSYDALKFDQNLIRRSIKIGYQDAKRVLLDGSE